MTEEETLDAAVEEFLAHLRAGKTPDVATFSAQYPAIAMRLRELLPLLLEVETLAEEKTWTPPAPDAPPTLEGSDFRLLRKIGSGGMGEVFEALQLSLNRKVAVKLLPSALLPDSARKKALLREAQVIAMLHHPNIVKVFYAGCASGHCFYAMELIQGVALNGYTPTSLREVVELGLQAARALAYAHRCGVLHRDIKPSNLLLEEGGTLRVGDFGLAAVQQNRSGAFGKLDPRSGTARYMAPERVLRGITTVAGDVYALGLVLYELTESALRCPDPAHWEPGKPPPPLQCPNPDLSAVITKCLCPHPSGRYPDMDSLAEDLRRVLDHEVVSARNPSWGHRLCLWAKRRPREAALTFSGVGLLVALVFALAFGYARTTAAWKQAERNASTADAALAEVFTFLDRQTPSAGGSALFSRLMPYWQEIAQQRALPTTRLVEAGTMAGVAAMRAGIWSTAEEAFGQVMARHPSAKIACLLAESLAHQGKQAKSEALYRQITRDYPGTCEAAKAFLALNEPHNASETILALLREDPANPDYRFQYACLLAEYPHLFRTVRIPGVEPNAVKLLLELAKASPEQPEYALTLVSLMGRRLRREKTFKDSDRQDVEQVLALSEQLVGRFPNTPGVVAASVKLRQSYIATLRRNGHANTARQETERLQGMLEVLFYNPDTPSDAKSALLTVQLERLERLPKTQPSETFDALFRKVQQELDAYTGDDRAVFLSRLEKAKTATPPRPPSRLTSPKAP